MHKIQKFINRGKTLYWHYLEKSHLGSLYQAKIFYYNAIYDCLTKIAKTNLNIHIKDQIIFTSLIIPF